MLQLYNQRTPARAHCKCWKKIEISSRNPQANTFVPFRRLWDFTITLKTVATFLWLRQLPLHSSTKTIIIWHSKQIKTLYNRWFGAVFSNIEFWRFIRKRQRVFIRKSPVYIKSWGNKSVEPFWFFQSSNPVEHMQIPKIISFKGTFFWKTLFSYQRSLTYENMDVYKTLLPIPNFAKYLKYPYIYHVYFVYNFNCLYSFV